MRPGVNVACGHDSIMDPWYPLGRGSMLDALSMLVHVAQMSGRTELFRAYEMITTNAARAAEVPYGVKEGLSANFVVFDCTRRGGGDPAPTGGPLGRPDGPDRGRDGARAKRRPPCRIIERGHVHEADAHRLTRYRGARRRCQTWRQEDRWRPNRYDWKGCRPTRATLAIEGHGMEPIPETARYGSVNRLFTVWFTPNLVPAAFFIGTLVALDLLELGLVTWVSRDHRRQRDGCRPSSACCRRWDRGPGWPRSRPRACRSARAIVVPGMLNWFSTIAWDGINAFFGAIRHDADDPRRDAVPGRPR